MNEPLFIQVTEPTKQKENNMHKSSKGGILRR